MRNGKRHVSWLIVALMLFGFDAADAQGKGGGEMLNEVPIWPVPAEMTLEEYTDANRRLSVGFALMAVPIPGSLHFYANERREGWTHMGAAALGVASVILGASMIDEKDAWKSSDFEVIDITGQSGEVRRYAKVPREEEAGATTYRLRKVEQRTKGGGGGSLFIVAGAGLFVGQLLHGWIDGIRTIERKRDAVRYKYGKSAGFGLSLKPEADIQRGRFGAALSMSF